MHTVKIQLKFLAWPFHGKNSREMLEQELEEKLVDGNSADGRKEPQVETNDVAGIISFRDAKYESTEMKQLLSLSAPDEKLPTGLDDVTYKASKVFPDWVLKNTNWIQAAKINEDANTVSDILKIEKSKRTPEQISIVIYWLMSVWKIANTMGFKRCDSMLQAFEFISYAPGENIIEEGKSGLTFYIIISGTTSVRKAGIGIVGTLGKGKSFGEIALTQGKELRTATVTATTPVDVVRLHKSNYDYFVRDIQDQEKRENFKVLSECVLFRTWPKGKIEKMSSSCLRKTLDQGEYVFHQGDPPNDLLVIVEGSVDIVKELVIVCRNRWPIAHNQWQERTKRIHKPILLKGLGVSDFFGEVAILKDAPRSTSAIATSRTILLSLDRLEFLHLISYGNSNINGNSIDEEESRFNDIISKYVDDQDILDAVSYFKGGPDSEAVVGQMKMYKTDIEMRKDEVALRSKTPLVKEVNHVDKSGRNNLTSATAVAAKRQLNQQETLQEEINRRATGDFYNNNSNKNNGGSSDSKHNHNNSKQSSTDYNNKNHAWMNNSNGNNNNSSNSNNNSDGRSKTLQLNHATSSSSSISMKMNNLASIGRSKTPSSPVGHHHRGNALCLSMGILPAPGTGMLSGYERNTIINNNNNSDNNNNNSGGGIGGFFRSRLDSARQSGGSLSFNGNNIRSSMNNGSIYNNKRITMRAGLDNDPEYIFDDKILLRKNSAINLRKVYNQVCNQMNAETVSQHMRTQEGKLFLTDNSIKDYRRPTQSDDIFDRLKLGYNDKEYKKLHSFRRNQNLPVKNNNNVNIGSSTGDDTKDASLLLHQQQQHLLMHQLPQSNTTGVRNVSPFANRRPNTTGSSTNNNNYNYNTTMMMSEDMYSVASSHDDAASGTAAVGDGSSMYSIAAAAARAKLRKKNNASLSSDLKLLHKPKISYRDAMEG